MSLGNARDFSLPVSVVRPTDNEGADYSDEGQLAVDVVETETELIVMATMAGTPESAIEIFLHNDLLTIKGRRDYPVDGGAHRHYGECYWGKFSRAIVLPTDVRADLARAEYRQGLLTIILPKTAGDSNIPIFVVDE